jgi:hypothetical protein
MPSIAEAIGDQIVRARHGDQNAMAMLSAIRTSAQQGSPRAQTAYRAALDYLRTNPASHPTLTASAKVGCDLPLRHLKWYADPEKHTPEYDDKLACRICLLLVALGTYGDRDDLSGAITILSRWKDLDVPRIYRIGSGIQDDQGRTAFFQAVRAGAQDGGRSLEDLWGVPPEFHPFVGAGGVVGRARALQLVRQHGTPLQAYCPQTAYELGEC